jgi:hypothetical protein
VSGTGFVKLYGTLLTSTVWTREDVPTRLVWITMLVLADADGVVRATIPGLAHMARVEIEECEHAIAQLSSPDQYSRTKEHEGRRIEPHADGWTLLNHRAYRERETPSAARMRRHRESKAANNRTVTRDDVTPEEEEEEKEDQRNTEIGDQPANAHAADRGVIALCDDRPGSALTHPVGKETVAQKRKRSARVVWEAHERRCVARGIGREALGGGLRDPQDTDLAAIIRCARKLMKQESLSERVAWLILRDAAVAAVDEAADAKDEGDDFAHKLITWRRRDPFGGKKLGPMLDALQRRRGRDPNDPGATGAPATTGPNRRSDEERAELARRVAEEKARAAGGSKTSK